MEKMRGYKENPLAGKKRLPAEPTSESPHDETLEHRVNRGATELQYSMQLILILN